jgi:hypothetical protein
LGLLLLCFALAAMAQAAGTKGTTSKPVAVQPANVTGLQVPFWGYLTEKDGTPVTGMRELKFELYDAAEGGTLLWTEIQNSVSITDGRLTTTLGASTALERRMFETGELWLNVTVNPNTDNAEVLSPRAKISTTNADECASAIGSTGRRGHDGSLDFLRVTGELVVDSSITGGFLTGSRASGAYSLAVGNNCQASGTNSSVAGGSGNTASGVQSVIGGGLNNTASAIYTGIGGGWLNIANYPYAYVGGGYQNTSSGFRSVVCAGAGNNAMKDYSFVGGGTQNKVDGPGATGGDGAVGTIGGGAWNSVSGIYGTVGGGSYNKVRSQFAFIGGGGGSTAADSNSASGDHAVIGGGSRNYARGAFSFIGGGGGNADVADSNSANGDHAVVGGGLHNYARGAYSVIAGGGGPAESDSNSTVGTQSVVGGGVSNYASNTYSTVSGGRWNHATGYGSVIAGGSGNTASGYYYPVIGGGSDNVAFGDYSTIANGWYNETNGYGAVISGGAFNHALVNYGSIGGGKYNIVTGFAGTIGGGTGNYARGQYSVVGGGGTWEAADTNSALGDNSVVAGGHHNFARGYSSVIGGGGGSGAADSNSARGNWSVIPGGLRNETAGSYAFAAGRRAKANNQGSFVWGDSYDGDVTSSANDQMTFRASGGVRFFSNTGLTAGVALLPGAGAWSNLSDRTKKENFRTLNTREILDKVDKLPVQQWNYKAQNASVKHVGPMAQDFYALFGLGDNDTTISTIDPSGIALAAIQELSKRVRELESQNQNMAAEVSRLTKTVETLAAREESVQKAKFTSNTPVRGSEGR